MSAASLKRAATVKPAAVAEEAAAGPAAKYPNLEKLNAKYWATLEKLNRSGPDARLTVRDTRNLMTNLITNELFWETVRDVVKRHSKFTNNKQKADVKVQVCNMAKKAIMTPGASEGLKKLTVDAYNAATAVQTDDAVETLRSLAKVVKSGRVNSFLEKANGLIDYVVLDPATVIKMFVELRKLTDSSSKMKLDAVSANRLINLSKNIRGNIVSNTWPIDSHW